MKAIFQIQKKLDKKKKQYFKNAPSFCRWKKGENREKKSLKLFFVSLIIFAAFCITLAFKDVFLEFMLYWKILIFIIFVDFPQL